jgi:hypothetical protein
MVGRSLSTDRLARATPATLDTTVAHRCRGASSWVGPFVAIWRSDALT